MAVGVVVVGVVVMIMTEAEDRRTFIYFSTRPSVGWQARIGYPNTHSGVNVCMCAVLLAWFSG